MSECVVCDGLGCEHCPAVPEPALGLIPPYDVDAELEDAFRVVDGAAGVRSKQVAALVGVYGAGVVELVANLRLSVASMCELGLDPPFIRLELELALSAWASAAGEPPCEL